MYNKYEDIFTKNDIPLFKNEGLVIINNKFILSLVHNRWRVKGKSIWYWYTDDIQKFKERYIDSDNVSQIENK